MFMTNLDKARGIVEESEHFCQRIMRGNLYYEDVLV
jgi:hypothetical protein